MNAYSKFMDISMHALPEPLTSADQTSFPWLKFAHVEYLLDPEINSLSLEAQGALIRLMCYAARQYPFASLPNDMPLQTGQQVVEDVKSEVTRKLAPCRIKKHLMLTVHGIEITEV